MTRTPPPHKHINDMWLALHNPNSRITNSLVPLVADMFLRQANNYSPDSDFSYEACIRRAERAQQTSDGGWDIRQDDLDKAISTTWTATQTLSLDIVRPLPEKGVKWIFQRAVAKAIQNGRLVSELTLFDEEMRVVAYGKGTDQLIPAQRWVEENRREGKGARLMKV
jgi:hypothetical protein